MKLLIPIVILIPLTTAACEKIAAFNPMVPKNASKYAGNRWLLY
jgi:hypothetical protein